MGQPQGFIELPRESPPQRAPLERVQDWNEIHHHLEDKQLRQQGARCMDCGVPFCQTGKLIGGAASGCPVNNLIPEWNDLVYRGLWRQALERLHLTNNFPEFTGRVCPAPCEGSCVLGMNASPVSIKALENSIIDKGFDAGWVQPHVPPRRSGKSVAVVGSGPAGLAAAAQLNRVGHQVTVLERADRPGGLLMYGIPNMKLAKRDIVLRRLDLLMREGIKFVCNIEVGAGSESLDLLREFDAVVLCTGATQPRDLPVEGRSLAGVHFAMDYLTASTRALLEDGTGPAPIDARDKDVVIIGGGDTGTDCVGTAMRQGCRSLVQLEILPRPPAVRAADNPWPEWPKIFRLDYGQEEAAARFGGDPRSYTTTVKGFYAGPDHTLASLVTVTVRWEKSAEGAWRAVAQPGSERRLPAQLALLATGFLGPEQALLRHLSVATDAQGNALADLRDYMTSVKGVFAAGDCRRGQSLVVWAIKEGREAARECDRYLTGGTALP